MEKNELEMEIDVLKKLIDWHIAQNMSLVKSLSKYVNMTIVLVTTGAREAIDNFRIETFSSIEQAEAFCKSICDKRDDKAKYWEWAEIVKAGVVLEPRRYETN